MAMSREGAQTRLRTLNEISGYLGQASKALSIYEADWGSEGFVHSILELTTAAYYSLETSKAILQEFVKDPLYSKKSAQEEEADDDFENVLPEGLLEPAFHAEALRELRAIVGQEVPRQRR